MENKHAYLIMVHNNYEQLKMLLSLLDDERNDIYIHIDKKSQIKEEWFDKVVVKSNLFFTERTSVFWADYSQFNAELLLLEEACNNEIYKYYHLLSGSDLPIKTQNQIHEFLDERDNEFLGICPQEVWYSVRRVKFYHPFTHNKFYRNHKELKLLDKIFEYVQKFIGINRLKNKEIKIIDGWNWFTISNDFARYILEKRNYIEKTFEKTIASDELVMQTMIYNNDKFYERIYDNKNLVRGSLRYIDWNRGKPYTFTKDDFQEIINQEDALFARKFDANVDSEIINMIYNYIDEKQKRGE